MKKLQVLLITLIICSFNLHAQIINTSIKNYKSFESGTTHFIKSGDEDLDGYTKALLTKYWTVNNFDMIEEKEVVEKAKEGHFYAGFFSYSYSREAGSTGALNMDYTVTKLLLFRGLKEVKKGDERKPVGTLSTIEVQEVSPADILYAIRILNSQIELVKELKYKRAKKFKDFIDEISERRKNRLQEKVLYISGEQLSYRIDGEEDVKKYYDYDFKIKSKRTIEQAILDQNPDVVYARFIRLGSLHFLMIIDAENSDLVFGKVSTGISQNMIGPRFFKKMSK